jgi:hypothetical protein
MATNPELAGTTRDASFWTAMIMSVSRLLILNEPR